MITPVRICQTVSCYGHDYAEEFSDTPQVSAEVLLVKVTIQYKMESGVSYSLLRVDIKNDFCILSVNAFSNGDPLDLGDDKFSIEEYGPNNISKIIRIEIPEEGGVELNVGIDLKFLFAVYNNSF